MAQYGPSNAEWAIIFALPAAALVALGAGIALFVRWLVAG